jgi:hypothetical protein
MQSKTAANRQNKTSADEAVRHIAIARHLLKTLRERLEQTEGHGELEAEDHAELDEAITNLEIALSHLTVNTGGML